MAATLLLFASAAFVGAAAARAQTAPATPLTVSKKGYFTSKIVGALPPVLVREVPPAPVCILVPQLCPAEVDALKTALSLNDGLPLPDVPDFLIPQPVPPGELPVGMIGGQGRYVSTLQFALPNLAPKSVVNRFDLVLKDGTVNFSIQSPAFRQAIFTALSQYPDQQPEVIQKFVDDVATQNTALADFEPTGIEACMVTTAWEAGESQDPATTPKIDCIVGGLGKHDDAAGTWTFDVSGIVQSWLDGDPNMGISFAPVGAQNVAYGDPDPSTNFILTLAAAEGGASAPTAVVDVGPPLEEILDTGDVLDDALDAGGDLPTDFASGTSGDVTTPAQSGSASAPAKARIIRSSADTPWWVWLVFPLVLLGCAALTIAVDAVPDLTSRRPGALTRLTADAHTRSEV